MKKLLQVTVVAFMIILCATGCGKEQDELLEYVNGDARKEITTLEHKAKDSYASVTGDNYKDDATMFQELSTNTANYMKQTIDKATSLGGTLEGEQLKKLHETYVSSLKELQNGIDQLAKATESGDAELAAKASETLSKANEDEIKYMNELKKLADELGVEVKLINAE